MSTLFALSLPETSTNLAYLRLLPPVFPCPIRFVLATAMLEIEDRITPRRVLLILRRSIDKATDHVLRVPPVEERLPQLSMRHVLHRVEVSVIGGYFHSIAPCEPSSCGVEVPTHAVFGLPQRELDPSNIKHHACGRWARQRARIRLSDSPRGMSCLSGPTLSSVPLVVSTGSLYRTRSCNCGWPSAQSRTRVVSAGFPSKLP